MSAVSVLLLLAVMLWKLVSGESSGVRDWRGLFSVCVEILRRFSVAGWCGREGVENACLVVGLSVVEGGATEKKGGREAPRGSHW